MSAKRATSVDAEVAKRVRAQRTRLGLSQTQVGQKLGVSFQQIQKYERGTNRIGAGRLFQLAAIFNIPIQALFPQNEQQAGQSSEERDALSDLLLTADGRRLCKAFLQVEDRQVRKQIIALVESVVDQSPPEPTAD